MVLGLFNIFTEVMDTHTHTHTHTHTSTSNIWKIRTRQRDYIIRLLEQWPCLSLTSPVCDQCQTPPRPRTLLTLQDCLPPDFLLTMQILVTSLDYLLQHPTQVFIKVLSCVCVFPTPNPTPLRSGREDLVFWFKSQTHPLLGFHLLKFLLGHKGEVCFRRGFLQMVGGLEPPPPGQQG